MRTSTPGRSRVTSENVYEGALTAASSPSAGAVLLRASPRSAGAMLLELMSRASRRLFHLVLRPLDDHVAQRGAGRNHREHVVFFFDHGFDHARPVAIRLRGFQHG